MLICRTQTEYECKSSLSYYLMVKLQMKHVLAVLQHHCCLFVSPRVCFHNIVYIISSIFYDMTSILSIIVPNSTAKITEGNVGLRIVRLTQEHKAAALVFQIWPFSLSGIDPDGHLQFSALSHPEF
ncbi:hypothetical protein R3I94_019164 [Phoxinus phoxinus]